MLLWKLYIYKCTLELHHNSLDVPSRRECEYGSTPCRNGNFYKAKRLYSDRFPDRLLHSHHVYWSATLKLEMAGSMSIEQPKREQL